MLDPGTSWLGPPDDRGPEVPRDRLQKRVHEGPAGKDAPPAAIDVASWRLEVFGTGLRGRPDAGHAVPFSYDDLLALPARTITATLGCAGNGARPADAPEARIARRWTGPPLYDVLELAGITFEAVSLIGEGLDEPVRQRGVGPARFLDPLPVEKALDDALVAYAMNGQQLSPEHGFPVRLIVPESEVDNVRWLGRIEVLGPPGTSR